MLKGKVKKLPDTVLQYLEIRDKDLLFWQDEDGSMLVDKCESPIEQLMFLGLADFFKNFEYIFENLIINIEVQKRFLFKGVYYRTDIFVNIGDSNILKSYPYVIECDGHQFHEKTKEQVRKDRQRERDLMKLGNKVIRFSGSEILEDPEKCARDFWDIVKSDMETKEGQ